jgi:hypothetical protein
MGYRDDFYIQANIIGYTGGINRDPTVYFLTGPAHGPNEFGHITQAHNIIANVGREGVVRAALYEMRQGAGGELEEWADGVCIHPSRNAFVAVSQATLPTLAQAIGRFPNQKRISDFALDKYFAIVDKSDREGGRRFSF